MDEDVRVERKRAGKMRKKKWRMCEWEATMKMERRDEDGDEKEEEGVVRQEGREGEERGTKGQ